MNWKKIIRISFILFLLTLQSLFLIAILLEHNQTVFIPVFIILISLALILSYFKAPLHHDEHAYEHVFVVLWIPVGALCAYYLNNILHLGPVLAASIVGTSASFLPILNKRSHYLKQLPPAFYCGAFIGMSSTSVASGMLFILAASVFTAMLMILSKSLFSGLGGKLGVLAFAGVTITSLLFFLLF
ncbi:hypothetical protein [Olivibacter sp. XZL3]|uniref:hypothetical protein n=1 Tax=Olivibacter sp. XZL3 TaxID=1735116 RepID=UPI00106474CB|nr:hypothetical protein [Olivibacter sp. XZL3]